MDRPQVPESVFTYGAPRLVFGPGAVGDLGHELTGMGAARVLVVTDAGLVAAGVVEPVQAALGDAGIEVVTYAGSHVEPTDASLAEAAAHAREHGPFDAVVAVGGGSSIDTAKAVDLLLTNPGEVIDYVNAPVGGGRTPEVPLLPLVAVPTTTGTGSESTTVCVLDVLDQRVKSGISHPRLRPVLAVVDPVLTVTQPSTVTAASGLDVLCHALESWTARPYTSFERKEPRDRVPYCGANPFSDLWAQEALRLMARSLRRAVADGSDLEARGDVALAATVAGIGFGNAGVHVPHANAYPIAGRVRGFRPPDYPGEGPLVPHGMAVALTAPEAFRLTFAADPDRHRHAARLLEPQGPPDGAPDDPAEELPGALVRIMRDVGMPSGLAEVGFGADDVPDLVEGALAQQRLLATAPVDVGAAELDTVLRRSLHHW